MAWNATLAEYRGKLRGNLPRSKTHDYKTMAKADPVFSRDLPF